MTILTVAELIDWSRAQFALTAMYHWLFVPLTLGLGFICAFMETIYYRRGFDPEWRRITRFWMRLFAINFAIGVATGLILEFEFGTNWSNYSFFVGDIFGAPLAIEGIFAFFMESTFFAVMFFGWNRVSPRFHLTSTWLTAIGANLSAYWILVANSWMQYPVGMAFNIETARNEMIDFAAVAFSPVAMAKFSHTVTSGFLLASVFVVAISAWYLIRRREEEMAKKSMKIASVFGIVSAVIVAFTGDISGVQTAKYQPAKLAAMEGLYKGEEGAALTVIGSLNPEKRAGDDKPVFEWGWSIDKMLSVLAYHDPNAFVPGFDDLVYGNEEQGIMSVKEKMARGKEAVAKMTAYREALAANDETLAAELKELFDPATPKGKEFKKEYFDYLGYAYLTSETDIIPPVGLVFYSFRVMVALGMWFIVLFAGVLLMLKKGMITRWKWALWLMLLSLPLPYIAGQAGWIVAEVGRQPWTVQGLLPTNVSVSELGSEAVKTTFWIFAVLFTVLLVSEISIMVRQIKIGPDKVSE